MLVTLAVALSMVLAGCTGMGGIGDLTGDETEGIVEADDDAAGADDGADGGESTDGADGDSDDVDDTADADEASDGADASDTDDGIGDGMLDSLVGDGEGAGADDEWFNLSAPGYYAFDLAGIEEETGEQVTGQLVYDIEDAGGEEVTTSVDYTFGDEQYQSTTTGPADEVTGQLFLTPAHTPVLALQSASLLYYFEMGFSDPSVGNRKQTTVDGRTQVTEVLEERSYAGVECSFVETTVDGDVSQQACLRGAEGGIAPYVATYTDEGDLELEVELVEYESD